MKWPFYGRLLALLGWGVAFQTPAAEWINWANQPYLPNGGGFSRLAADNTNLYAAYALDGVFISTLAGQHFEALPMTGFPLWDPYENTNGYAVWNIHVAPQGTLLISGTPIVQTTNGIGAPPPGSPGANNTLPVFYWWDGSNQVWQAATITGKTYPYTAGVGNFYNAPDGSVWTCSGFASYVYRSTDDGRSFTAFDVNARVPANYLPLPGTTNVTGFGKIFGLAVGWNGEVVVGTETGGYLHSTNNGTNWSSLDPNFVSLASTNPLGRIGNALPAGLDHYGNFLLGNYESTTYPGHTNWDSITLIGYHPADGTIFNAASGFPASMGPGRVVTLPSGYSCSFLSLGTNELGGPFLSFNGRTWTQSISNLPVVSPNVGNAVVPGNAMTQSSNTVFISFGGIWTLDTTSAPITNTPPVAFPQNVNLLRNTPVDFVLGGADDTTSQLNYTITQLPVSGTITGIPPRLTYTPLPNRGGGDVLAFQVDDGMAASAPVYVNFAINAPTNPLPTISVTSTLTANWVVAPTNLTFTASVTAPVGFQQVNFYNGTNFIKAVVKPPYSYTLTNPVPGVYAISARVGDKREDSIWAPPVVFSVLPAIPRLRQVQMEVGTLTLTWPLALEGFWLESAPDPSGPWGLVPQAPLYTTNGLRTVLPDTEDQQFFRLMTPQ